MNDTTFSQEPSQEPLRNSEVLSPEGIPRFGAVDIVEAFTAMRHEWRGQTKESRALAEQIQTAAANLLELESKLFAGERRPDKASDVKRLVMLIVETDHQLSRAVASIAQWEANRRLGEAAKRAAIEQCVAAMNSAARWFSRPLLALLAGQHSAQEPAESSPTLDGLNLVLARLRRMMREHGIERHDVLGRPFDANTMHAIGAVVTADYPAGHVADQLSPAYSWLGQFLRFADVRVADHKTESEV